MGLLNFTKKNTIEAGGKYGDRDWTLSGCKWISETAKSGFTGVYFHSDLVGPDGSELPKNWLLMEESELRETFGIQVNDDGQLEIIDEDLAKTFRPKSSWDTVQLFNSMEDAGVPAKILANIEENPGGVDGYTVHMIDKPTGKMQKRKNPRTGQKEDTNFPQTWLVVESIVAEPGGKKSSAKVGGKASATSATSAAAMVAKAKVKAKAAEEEEEEGVEEEEEESDEDVSPAEQAAIELVQMVLAASKKKEFIPTYNAKQYDGGVSLSQMGTAALGNAIPKDTLKTVKKADVQKLVRSADFAGKYDGELWAFDSDEGVYSAID